MKYNPIKNISDNQEFYKNVDKFLIDNNKIYKQFLYEDTLTGKIFIIFIYEDNIIYKRKGAHFPFIEPIETYPEMKNPFIENIKYET